VLCGKLVTTKSLLIPASDSAPVSVPPETAENRLLPIADAELAPPVFGDAVALTRTLRFALIVAGSAVRCVSGMSASYNARGTSRLFHVCIVHVPALNMIDMRSTMAAAAFESAPKPAIV
jgi:hypothetical protein